MAELPCVSWPTCRACHGRPTMRVMADLIGHLLPARDPRSEPGMTWDSSLALRMTGGLALRMTGGIRTDGRRSRTRGPCRPSCRGELKEKTQMRSSRKDCQDCTLCSSWLYVFILQISFRFLRQRYSLIVPSHGTSKTISSIFLDY